VDVHLIDGTYELFRHFFALPAAADVNGQETGAVRGVLTSVWSMIERGVTHIGVATDHVVESFRNDLYPGYKTSEGCTSGVALAVPRLHRARYRASGPVERLNGGMTLEETESYQSSIATQPRSSGRQLLFKATKSGAFLLDVQ
jgi:hypothetical protein